MYYIFFPFFFGCFILFRFWQKITDQLRYTLLSIIIDIIMFCSHPSHCMYFSACIFCKFIYICMDLNCVFHVELWWYDSLQSFEAVASPSWSCSAAPRGKSLLQPLNHSSVFIHSYVVDRLPRPLLRWLLRMNHTLNFPRSSLVFALERWWCI